ncbi:6-phosphogluconolactonase [Schlesneria sp. T3-172]|uniref:6-phosphogluconolactonase n=1 Tax=Schlesneria sphaerica TaxID=3373610 RepID=UPI0037C4F6A5
MNLEVLTDADTVARQAASEIACFARSAVAERGQFLLAVSGGRTPWVMLKALTEEEIPWGNVHIFQVDERAAPDGHSDRNLTHLRASLAGAPIPESQIHAMNTAEQDLQASADQYGELLRTYAGVPPVLDLVHLGLGTDGHTASLVPNDAALSIEGSDVAVTDIYQGRQRMTLTFPVLNRSRTILWVVTGAEKREMLSRLQSGDHTIPAGRIRRDDAIILADQAAAGTT